MLKNITFSADPVLIHRARERASEENTTLNAEFRRWLAKYADRVRDGEEYARLMDRLSYVCSGGAFSREALNER